VAHRDVKPDNFLAVDGRPAGSPGLGFTVKLCDFGLSGRVSSPPARELLGVFGTTPYIAPEVLAHERYSTKADMWSLGATAFVLVYGRWPYMPGPDQHFDAAIRSRILAGTPAPCFRSDPGLPQVFSQCRGWVRALLQRLPSDRPSANEALQHRTRRRLAVPPPGAPRGEAHRRVRVQERSRRSLYGGGARGARVERAAAAPAEARRVD